MIVSLPAELWLHIATFTTEDDLPTLTRINKLFHEFAMNERYRQVDLTNPNPHVFWNTVQMLQSSSVANRVRVLNVHPRALWAGLNPPPLRQPKLTRRQVLIEKYRKFITRMRTKELTSNIKSPYPKEIYPLFMDSLVNLNRILECRIVWGHGMHLPHIPQRTLSWSTPLLDIFTSTNIGDTLKTLSIDAPVLRFKDVTVNTNPPFTHLNELQLTFHPPNDVYTMFNILPPFIKGVSSTLTILSITTRVHISVSSLLLTLGRFPQLKKLSLRLSEDFKRTSNTSGIRRFLQNNRTIEDLSLLYDYCCNMHRRHREYTIIGNDHAHVCSDDIELPHLHSLEYNPRLLQMSQTNFLNDLCCVNKNLTSLTLVDCNLMYKEVQTLLRGFGRLKTLSLVVHTLSPGLIALVASNCPLLVRLTITAQIVNSRRNAVRDDGDGFITGMMNRKGLPIYIKWQLEHITILRWIYGVGKRPISSYMKAVGEVAPMIRDKTD
ncbi:hypothetical protein BDQ12DRAFT_687579 [Crucibulum laeve]|uniref:F-box domain-containing protein n=1 Tax=Crucibulum laeve TaxID=68775 RepID=A0A5C3LTT6_9AGAR|nr:hypothetical protein BDQ12DRAFT_687579 [Crucibulum laeve]